VDVIVLELVVPHLTAAQFADQYRRQTGAAAAPIVLVSASRKDRLAEVAAAMGAAAFVAKPFGLEEFVRVLSSVLHHASAPQQGVPGHAHLP
jgi:CheY-like chemotaxis protein